MFDGQYTLWGSELSLFTRKLQAQLNYQQLPYELRLKAGEDAPRIEARTGSHFIPALETPEGWMLSDTTPIAQFLHERHHEAPVLPATPVQRIASHLLEDWIDEWFGLYAIHTRWCYDDNVDAIASVFAGNLLGVQSEQAMPDDITAQVNDVITMARDGFGLPACERRGCGIEKAAGLKEDFQHLASALAHHFSQHRYLLGDRACPADFAQAGYFAAHCRFDPVAIHWVEEAAPTLLPHMHTQFATGASDSDNYLAGDQLPASLAPFFDHMRRGQHQYLMQSREALANGDKWLEIDTPFGRSRMRALKYAELSRCHVRNELLRLSEAAREEVDRVLGQQGVIEAYYLPPVLMRT